MVPGVLSTLEDYIKNNIINCADITRKNMVSGYTVA